MSLSTIPRLASCVIVAFAAIACSDSDEPSEPVSSANPNQPAASNGGSANAGSAGSAGAPSTTANGGSSSEAPPTPALNQGGSAATDPGASNAGDAGAGLPPVTPVADAAALPVADATTSFFLASRGSGQGGNFGGIAGADALCETLAAAANPALAAKTWRAYLSTSTENARDRIGAGPWRNAAGVIIANSVDELHDQAPGQATGGASEANYPPNDINTALREDGTPLPAQPVFHDILTGSNLDGTVSASGTCSDWTATTGTTRNGHSNRAGGGENRLSWNSAHDTGCAEPTAGGNFEDGTVSQGGGIGAIYCFAAD